MPVELTTQLRDLVSALDARLALSMTRFPQDADSLVLPLPQPLRLAGRVSALSAIFDDGRPAEPPSQARINALGRLRAGTVRISRKDWNLIAWGLCDQCGHAGMPIDEASLFSKIMDFVDTEVTKGISRKVWFGLLHSYFSYPSEPPESCANWLQLRARLAETLPVLIQGQTRPKAWSRALDRHSELLTDRAGLALGAALFDDNKEIAQDIASYLPIPATSWLWRRIISAQLAMLSAVSDERFLTSVSSMMKLAGQHPLQTDSILAALLTRYQSSSYRNEPNLELKQFALDHWQNPQMKSANRWSLVGEDVRKMMLHWFAKADLEHFFSLLQGEGGVDRARLDYWLRFVDQISYTRIVMGTDAYFNPSDDFVDFRAKNKGRFSQMTNGDPANNAFAMRLGEYYFIEFSGTGNACYVYAEDRLPFNPETSFLRLAQLKTKSAAIDRIIHNGAWTHNADRALARLGIFPGMNTGKKTAPSAPPAAIAPLSATPTSLSQWLARNDAPLGPQPPTLPDSVMPTSIAAPVSNFPIPSSHFSWNGDKPLGKPNDAGSRGRLARLMAMPPKVNPLAPAVIPAATSIDIEPETRSEKAARAVERAIAVGSELAARLQLTTMDNRYGGGAFWVHENGSSFEAHRVLKKAGFVFKAGRGYWIK